MKIVVRGTNWIGDAVMSVPAMRELRRTFPEAEIALHTYSWAEGIFRDADFLDQLIAFERSPSALKNALVQGRRLRHEKFDLAILFPNSFESALAVRLAGIPSRFGYSRDARRVLLTDPVAVPEWKDRRHQVFYYLNLIAEVEKKFLSQETILDAEPSIALPVSAGRRDEARMLLKDLGVDLQKKIVALGVGSTNSRAKRWLPENFAALNDRLREELDANVILVGSEDEADVAAAVAGIAKQEPILLVGKTSLEKAAAVLSEADLLISNDMGLAHIAPAVETRTIVLFGPTNAALTAPFSPLASVINKAVECSPCMLRDCPIDHRCMTRITVGDVLEQARIALEN